jgi:hypothetical protein
MSNATTLSVGQICQQVPAAFSHAEILKVIFGVMICILLAALDQAAVIPAVPAIAQELGATKESYGRYLDLIRNECGHMPVAGFRPSLVQKTDQV